MEKSKTMFSRGWCQKELMISKLSSKCFPEKNYNISYQKQHTMIRAEETLAAPWTRINTILILSRRLNWHWLSSVCRHNVRNWFLSCMFTCLTSLIVDRRTKVTRWRTGRAYDLLKQWQLQQWSTFGRCSEQ